MKLLLILCIFCIMTACKSPIIATSQQSQDNLQDKSLTEEYSILSAGTKIGALIVTTDGNSKTISYEINNNGRGSSSNETLLISEDGIPLNWQIKGKTTFGNAVDESFSIDGDITKWSSAAGEGNAPKAENSVYIAQNASPYSTYIYANALLKSNQSKLDALPAGQINITQVSEFTFVHADGTADSSIDAKIMALGGINIDPTYFAVDQQNQFVALLSPRFSMIKEGYESSDTKLRSLATTLNTERLRKLADRVSHSFEQPVRINNVRIFDPNTLALTALQSVVFIDNKIVSVEAPIAQPNTNEVFVDGEGGTLIAGLFEMHGHLSDNRALFNVIAGVTSVRDTGNEIPVMEKLVENISTGELIGPRITRSGFIEGISDFSNATGELASSKEKALELVRQYAEMDGYKQIKLYSSINGKWVEDIAKEADKHGLRVMGHIPAFSKVDEMILAGYDEITHINQVMLSWVLERHEDTRTLFRITGMKRFADLDLETNERAQDTLNLMVERNIAVDPTIVIHEFGLTARNGETRQGMVDYIDNMPISVQRRAKVALLNVANEEEDLAYRQAFEKVLETLTLMHEKGIMLVPGTDLGGGFELHRELELFTKIGMTPAEAVKRGSYDMANYLGYGNELGSIEEGKLADFFLISGDPTQDIKAIKTPRMVVANGKVFFPSEIYPEFGITPFTEKPSMKQLN